MAARRSAGPERPAASPSEGTAPLTRTLLIAIALLFLAGAWRIGRWHWRPRLVLPRDVILERRGESIHVLLDVRNEGAGRSRGCRAVLVRCEKREDVGWLRFEPPDRAKPTDPGTSGTGIEAGGTARIELDRALPDEPGDYRLEIAVLNGEEKRASYVIRV